MPEPTPETPAEAGVVEETPELSAIEGARILGNDARKRLHADGFTDAQIDAWAETFIAEESSGSVDQFVAWIAAAGSRRLAGAPALRNERTGSAQRAHRFCATSAPVCATRTVARPCRGSGTTGPGLGASGCAVTRASGGRAPCRSPKAAPPVDSVADGSGRRGSSPPSTEGTSWGGPAGSRGGGGRPWVHPDGPA